MTKKIEATTKTTEQDGKYRVRLFIDGIYQAGGDYFTDDKEDAETTAKNMRKNPIPTDKTDENAIREQQEYDQSVKEEKNTIKERDSVGGVVEVIAKNVPVGLGEPVYEKLSSEIGKAMLSINATKGVEIGSGFEGTKMRGSIHNDSMKSVNNDIKFSSNHAGGILGGISTGQDIVVRLAFKPLASIAQKQKTINKNLKNVNIEITGRHDVCVCPRAVPVVEAMLAIVILNALMKQKARN